jgi:hypothetical protein
MKAIRFLFLISVLVPASAFATEPERPLLPTDFAGWHAVGTVQSGQDPAVADAVDAPVLKEYGFTDFESATYERDGRKLTIKAARFTDASGGMGAFSFFRTSEMLREDIGDQAASLNQRVLFYRANIVVDAVFEKLTAMSAAELRELGAGLPIAGGSAQNPPPLPNYLPRQAVIRNSAKYVLGPVGLDRIHAPLTADIVDFGAGAEVVIGQYTPGSNSATLMLISYPTPQIAAEHLKRIDQAKQGLTAPANPNQPPVMQIGEFFAKRTGPIVAVVSGSLTANEAKSLLGQVHYDAEVTWNERFRGPRDNIGNLLVGIILLCAMLIGITIVAGIAFGGARVLLQRIFPGRFFERPEAVEFISLHLADTPDQTPSSKPSASI